jgi:hypothetical protein
MTYIYLGSPYTDPRPSMMAHRYKRNRAALRKLTSAEPRGTIFAPIFVGHQLAGLGVELTHAGWMAWCLRFLRPASALYVLTLPGWEDSVGLGEEVRLADNLGLPIIGCDILDDCESVSGYNIRGNFGLKGTGK